MGKLSQKKDQNIIKQSKGLKKKSVSSEKQTLKKTKKPDQKAHSSSSKKLKKSLKANDDNSDGKEVSDSLRQELEVMIKNLNKSGDLQKHFIIEDNAVENGEEEFDDEIEEISVEDDFDDVMEPKQIIAETDQKKEVNQVSKKAKKKSEKGEGRADYIFVKDSRNERSQCIMKTKDGGSWFTLIESKPEIENLEKGQEDSEYWLSKIEKFTKKIYDEEVENFKKQAQKETKKSSEKRFMETVLKSGTLGDKISANAVMIQESPFHQLPLLQSLIEMVSLKSRRPCILAMDALQSLFVNFLLVPDRKLRFFSNCPVRHLDRLTSGNKDLRDKYLMMWWFEHQLKSLYSKFLEALAEVGKDTIENTRGKVLKVTLELLMANPEQEQELLSRIINKLGDPVRKVAAKATYQIGLLLEKHPAMKGVVLSEIERLIHRTNVSPKAQYYGICCLTQLLLDDSDEDKIIANKLIKIYFAFFKSSIKKGEIDTKMVSGLLAGVHRAYPFASLDSEILNSQLETMYKVAHMSTFNIAIQAFMLLFQVMGSGEAVTDRFYNAFYKKLLSPDLSSSSKPALFLNLTFKVIKNDPSANRAIAFIKRMLQLAFYWPSSLTCSLMYLISEIVKARPEIILSKKVDESIFETEGKSDFGRFDDEGEADDYRKDVALSDDDSKDTKESKSSTQGSSWLHRNLSKTRPVGSKSASYNPLDRNPLYSGAEKTNMWELSSLAQHIHPSAQMFTQNILEGSEIKYSGDPLADFMLMRFLDRFVFRNPKKDPAKNKPTNVFSKRNVYFAPSGVKRLAPDSKEYVERDESSVPLDERFIHKFFADKKSKVSDPQDSDAGSVNSDDAMNALDMFAEKDPDDLDFASAVKATDIMTGKKRKSQEASDEEDESDDEDDLESEGEDVIEDNEDDFEEVDDFEDLEDDFEIDPVKKRTKASGKSMKISQKRDSGLMFASAEEFASIIDENEGDLDEGKLDRVLNKDKSAEKQLAWEKKRYSDSKGTFSKKMKGKKFASSKLKNNFGHSRKKQFKKRSS